VLDHLVPFFPVLLYIIPGVAKRRRRRVEVLCEVRQRTSGASADVRHHHLHPYLGNGVLQAQQVLYGGQQRFHAFPVDQHIFRRKEGQRFRFQKVLAAATNQDDRQKGREERCRSVSIIAHFVSF